MAIRFMSISVLFIELQGKTKGFLLIAQLMFERPSIKLMKRRHLRR